MVKRGLSWCWDGTGRGLRRSIGFSLRMEIWLLMLYGWINRWDYDMNHGGDRSAKMFGHSEHGGKHGPYDVEKPEIQQKMARKE